MKLILLVLLLSIASSQNTYGGWSHTQKYNPNDQSQLDALVTSIQGIRTITNLAKTYVQVLSVSTKVVNGNLIKMNIQMEDSNKLSVIYQVIVLSQEWLNVTKVISMIKLSQQTPHISQDSFSLMIEDCKNQVYIENGEPLLFDSANLVSQQVVSGMNYNFDLQFTDTQDQIQIFTCSVWSRPWLSPPYIVTKAIKTEKPAESTGKEPLPVEFVQFSESCKTKIHESNTQTIQYLSTQLVSQQVVQGMSFTFVLSFLNQLDKIEQFNCNVWSRPWMNPPFIVTQVGYANKQFQ